MEMQDRLGGCCIKPGKRWEWGREEHLRNGTKELERLRGGAALGSERGSTGERRRPWERLALAAGSHLSFPCWSTEGCKWK